MTPFPRENVLDAVRAVVPQVIDAVPRGGEGKAGRCLPASRVGMETLRYFGIRAEAVAFNTLAANAAWVEWRGSADDPTTSPMPEEAWSVAVTAESPGPGLSAHVCLLIPQQGSLPYDHLLDLDSINFARPDHGILVPPSLLLPCDLRGDKRCAAMDGDGWLIAYAERLDRIPYRDAPDWRLSGKLAGQAIRRVKALLAEAA